MSVTVPPVATASAQAATSSSIVVTGAGLVSAAGSSMADLAETLRQRRHCLRPISSFDTTGLGMTHAGEVRDFDPLLDLPPGQVNRLDRGTQMALRAAGQALAQSGLDPASLSAAGVAIGTSGTPQYQNVRVPLDQIMPDSRIAALYNARTTPMFQADVLARTFGLGGPRFAFGSASLGGLLALVHAMDLLRTGHAPALLVGGGEILTMVSALGMDALGVNAVGPCTPFVGQSGMCFGEGAAFFVLERQADAENRGATVLAELVNAGISADAHSDVGQDPSGSGLARAVRKALGRAGVEPMTIGWIRACGTGQRDLDQAEALGLRSAFSNAPPPVTSTEPYFSHVNGVSPLLGLAAVLSAMETDQAPCLPDPDPLRGALGLNLLEPGKLPEGDCLLTATAFGGTNGAVLVRRPVDFLARRAPAPPATQTTIAIAGMGAVSALGGSVEALLGGVGVFARPAGNGAARLVDDAWLRPKLPGVQMQRRERVIRMALVAVSEALNDAGISPRGSARVGLLVGLTRGRAAATGRFYDHLMQGRFDVTTGREMLRTGRFSFASEIAHVFGLLGYSGAMACGVNGGVQLLAHGAEVLRASPDLEAILVVAADEWTSLLENYYRRLGLLGDGYAHDEAASGCIGGEGAAAVVLCRREVGTTLDSDWATIGGTGFTGDVSIAPDPGGLAYRRAIETAIGRACCAPNEIDFAIGQGCGWLPYDRRERVALGSICPDTPLTSVLPYTGVAESAGGLFSAIVGAAALRGGSVPALPAHNPASHHDRRVSSIEAALDFRHGLLLGSSERGAHAAIVLSRTVA